MILDDIVAKKKTRVDTRKKEIPIDMVKEKALEIVKRENELYKGKYENPFKKALSKECLSVIGEFKKASPSKGIIVENFNIENILNYYNFI